MAFQKLASKSLLSVTLATGLIVANTFSSALAVEIPTAFTDKPATVEQKTLLGRMVATSLGTLSGMMAYSLVTGDWSWALLATGSSMAISTAVPVAAAAAATVGTTTAAGTAGAVAAEVAAATAASTAAPAAAVGAAAEVAAATTGAAIPAAATVTPAAGATATSTSATIAGIFANRWAPVTASGLAGAILGNVIYSYK